MVYAQPIICPGEWDTQSSLEFWDANRSPNLVQTTRPSYNLQKKENLPNSGLYAVPVDHRVEWKEKEKNDKYQDLAKEQKNIEHEGDGDTNCN